MGRTFSPTCLPGRRYLQFQSAASLYLGGASPWFPAAASRHSLPARGPALQEYALNSARACVRARTAPTPQSLHLEGCQRARGATKAATPNSRPAPTIPLPLPLQTCPLSSHRTGERQLDISGRPGKGLRWGPPWSVLRRHTKAGLTSVPWPLLASSCTGTQGPPWSELLHGSRTHKTVSMLPRGGGHWGKSIMCPLLSLIQLDEG